MPVFLWEGREQSGNHQKGKIEAENEAAVCLQLRSKRITPIRIRPKPKSLFSAKFGARQQKITPKDVVIFTRQFSTMIDAGTYVDGIPGRSDRSAGYSHVSSHIHNGFRHLII